jgi:chromosomal replication initiator protein
LQLPAQPELISAWCHVRTEIRAEVGETTYQIWIAPLEPLRWDGTVLVLRAPADTKAWIAERFSRVLERCVRSSFGPGALIEFTTNAPPGGTAPARRPARPISEPTTSFNPRYSFEQFVMGDTNRLAHAAALAVAENPGDALNPLFLYGPPGLGKTHLLHAIGNYLATYSPQTVVRYTTVEDFTNGFITALGSKSVGRFKQLHRDVDVLLIDDVQFLASKAKTEEEFFHTFNAIHGAGRQLVLTCDRLPSQLVAIEERLRNRFQSGLVAELSAPDHATRVAILRKRVALDGLRLTDPGVLEFIAEQVADNIRSLEGALIRLAAVHSLRGRPLDVALAAEVLGTLAPRGSSDGGPPTVRRIQEAVAEHFKLTPAELCSASRAMRVTWPRQLAIHLARELTGQSLQSIGQAFGGRNHATALHACRRVSREVESNAESAAALDELLHSLAPHHDQAQRPHRLADSP